ncbi:MAG: divalent cation tolerance protein CutA [Candidatus Eisenbacteria bacterium]|nr:divalent cation tolerance protein CutA [Candidatus Eisenbacteria bacterium]
MTEVRIILVTVPDHDTALRLARRVTEEKLAACVNVLPGLTSVYEWEGKICEDSEELLVIKTTSDLTVDLLRLVEKEHPYDVPEGLAIPVAAGLDGYVKWVGDVTRGGAGREDA